MFVDSLARRVITASGIGSIVAVSLVGLFLVWVVVPLLAPTSIRKTGETTTPREPGGEGTAPGSRTATVVRQVMDDYGSMVWSFRDDGTFSVRGLAPGQSMPGASVADSLPPTAWAFAGEEGRAVFGFADGTVLTATAGFEVDFLDDGEVPERYHELRTDETAVWEGSLLTRTPESQLRRQTFVLEKDDPVALGASPIRLLDIVRTSAGVVLVAVDEAGVIHDRTLTWKTNMLTGKKRLRSRGGDLDLAAAGTLPEDEFVLLLQINREIIAFNAQSLF